MVCLCAGLLLGGLFVVLGWPVSGGAAGHEAGMPHPARAQPPRTGASGGPVGPIEGARGRPPDPRPMAESRRHGGTRVFGLARPGQAPGEVLFATARKAQPGGPETARAVEPSRYLPVRLAPDAEIWVTAPLADREPADYVQGVRIAPGAFARLYRGAQRRLGGVIDARAHMFELWLDDRGRATRLRHYFSP